MTSDRRAAGHPSVARLVMVLAVVAAVVFGLFLGYLALANDSFPADERPFSNYAAVASSTFNGTEFAFTLTWRNSTYLPLYAQLTSPATDSANTPVCDLQLSTAKAGQSIFMPFTISPATATLSNVNLNIAVRSLGDNSEFTIVYEVNGGGTVDASNSAITPSNVSCQQPIGS